MSNPPTRPMHPPPDCADLLGPVATRVVTLPTGAWRTSRPSIEYEKCSHCGLCADYCPPGAIELQPASAEPVVVDWIVCKGCGVCANICPKGCLSMVPEPGGRDG